MPDHPHLSLIAAMAENRVIGRAGELPWNLPDEMRHFVRTTKGHTVIMGRKTFESFGNPLPNRRNIVITRDPDYRPAGAEVAHSLDEALTLSRNDARVFIAGGADVYRQSLPLVARMYLTTVHASPPPEGDTYFPDFDKDAWRTVEEHHHPADARHAHVFTIRVLDRA